MASPSYTCISCRVAFANADLQRAHYKSDWHRYNLKRKLAEMVPVTAEEFKQRVLDKQVQVTESQQDSSMMCKVCSKHFNTGNAFSNHMQSKKHKETEARITRQIEAEVEKRNEKNREKGLEDESTSQTGEKVAAGHNKVGVRSVDKTMKTEEKTIGGRLQTEPVMGASSSQDVEMVDEEDAEWEEIEGEPIPITDCLFCSHSSKSVVNNCKHMTQSHSFFLPNVEYMIDLEGLLAYLGEKVGCGFMCLWCNDKGRTFFSLDAVQRHMRDKGHCKLQYEGDAVYEYAEYFDFRKSYPDSADCVSGGDTEADSDEEEVDENALQLQQDGFELVLPSGSRIGHRELQRYFRQNIPASRQIVKRNSEVIGRIMTQYKALGWNGNKGEAAERRIRDMRFVQKFRSRKDLRLAVKANKFQPHLRPQVIF